MAQDTEECTSVQTTINYFDDPGVPLVPMIIGGPEKPKPQPKVAVPTTITNVNGHEDEFSLDCQGFQYVRHKAAIENFDDFEKVKREHYPEMEKLLWEVLASNPKLPKPSSIHILTHIMRYSPVDGEPPKGPAGPLYGVHVDQSLDAATGVAHRWLGDEQAATLLATKARYQIINLWRPVLPNRQPITRDPFAVCDARSVPETDIVLVPVQFPDHRTEAVEVRPPPPGRPHRWYFKDGMTSEDVLVFKQVESYGAAGVPRRVPHCAFRDPRFLEGRGAPRQSVEVRAMVFYDQAEVQG